MRKYTTNFTIKENVVCGEKAFRLTLKHPSILPDARAGQFVEVLVPDCAKATLRRPISIHDIDSSKNLLTLLIQQIGEGTERLSQLHEGDNVNLIYPLGNGFLQCLGYEPKKPLLVGGGIGAAPLMLLARQLLAKGAHPTILLGARTAGLIPAREDFERLHGVEIHYSTDDGTLGEHGLVTANSAFDEEHDAILACGPTPMMRALAHKALQLGVGCEVSLENNMACGLGACLCCVTETVAGHKCVCTDGPVFTPQALMWS